MAELNALAQLFRDRANDRKLDAGENYVAHTADDFKEFMSKEKKIDGKTVDAVFDGAKEYAAANVAGTRAYAHKLFEENDDIDTVSSEAQLAGGFSTTVVIEREATINGEPKPEYAVASFKITDEADSAITVAMNEIYW